MVFHTVGVQRIFLCVACVLSLLIYLPVHAKDIANFHPITFDELVLDQEARELSAARRKKYGDANSAFIWSNKDNWTNNWRPQGITKLDSPEKSILAVSWYGRKQQNYSDRGVRISLIDHSDMQLIKYTHVLLIDETGRTFNNMHAGGLAFHNGRLHVPDTRNNQWLVHVFPMESLKVIPENDRRGLFGFKYFWVRESSYSVPITPSFMSYDYSRNKFLIGSFHKKKTKHLLWQDPASQSTFIKNLNFKKMQGAVSKANRLWISTSYGQFRNSALHEGEINSEGKAKLSNFRKIQLPPGLEDLHISSTSENIWTLTEFGPHEGFNNRVVFSIDVSNDHH